MATIGYGLNFRPICLLDNPKAYGLLLNKFASSCWMEGRQIQVFALLLLCVGVECSYDAGCMNFAKTKRSRVVPVLAPLLIDLTGSVGQGEGRWSYLVPGSHSSCRSATRKMTVFYVQRKSTTASKFLLLVRRRLFSDSVRTFYT